MSWNIGDDRNLFLKLKSKLELYHVVLTTTKTSPKKLTLTVVEMQQLPDIEKTDSKEEISCLKWTKHNGRRKVCVNFQTDTDKLNIVVYRYRNNLCLKDNEIILKLSEYEGLLAKRLYISSYIDILHASVRILDFLYVRWTKNKYLVEPLVIGTRTLNCFFIISKYLDYTQYYMMRLEQCGNIVAKMQATAT